MIIKPTGFFKPAASGGWTPPAGCLCWLKDSVTLASGKVASWNDMSLSGNHFVQADADHQPTQVAAVQNGQPGIHFDGSSAYLTCSAFRSGTEDSEMFMVLQSLETHDVQNNSLLHFGTNAAYSSWSGGAGVDGSSSLLFGTPYGNYVVGAFVESVFNVLNAYTTVALPHVKIWVNGVLITPSGSYDPAWRATFVLGSASPYAVYWHGYMGEFIMFNTALSVGDRANVNAYLKTKWATP
jgi:hypothetical protein